MLGRRKPLWDPQLDDLPDTEKPSVLAALYYLKMAERNLRKRRLSPLKKSLAFEALIARVAAPDIGARDEQDPRDLYEIAHRLRDSTTVVAGSPVRNGPYGDLFHRVLWGWSIVLNLAFRDRMGYAPEIDPIDTVPAPDLRHFLDAAAGRYADALTQAPIGSTRGAFPDTLVELSQQLHGAEPELVSSLRSQEPFVSGVQGIDFVLPYDQFFDMTGDDELSTRAAGAAPV